MQPAVEELALYFLSVRESIRRRADNTSASCFKHSSGQHAIGGSGVSEDGILLRYF